MKGKQNKNMAGNKECAVAIREWFVSHDWKFTRRTIGNGDVAFKTGVAAESSIFKGYDVSIICRDGDVQSLFYLPMRPTPKDYARVAEYLMRVNYRFRVGKFTLDYRDGEIRWEVVKDSASMKSDIESAMDDLIGFSEYVCDGFADGIVQVLTGAKTPLQAYEEADARDEQMDDDQADTEEEAEEVVDEDIPDGSVIDGTTDSGVVLPESVGEDVTPEPKGCKSTEGTQKTAKSSQQSAPSDSLPKGYSLECVNVEGKISLEEIVNAIRKFQKNKCVDIDAPRLGILLGGVPGAGKTAYARHIASEVGMKLITVKASDVLSHLVGETEHRIEEIFTEARKQGAILFLDEVDSLILNRKYAERSFEITQTNQLLQCIESFGGVLIAATNRVEQMDEAVMRRFTYKLKLSYLTAAGKTLMFKRYFDTPLTEEQQKRLDSLEQLTPGDFRTVKEGLYYLADDKQNNDARLDALEAEAEAKAHPRAKIGF